MIVIIDDYINLTEHEYIIPVQVLMTVHVYVFDATINDNQEYRERSWNNSEVRNYHILQVFKIIKFPLKVLKM